VRRFAASVAVDVRLQYRNGFYAATAVVVAVSILLLRWLPAEASRLVLPAVIVTNVLTNTFYFVSGLLLLERIEGSFTARAVTPLRPGEYLASKLVTLTALSLVESLLIAVASFGMEARPAAVAAGVVSCAVLFCLAGVAVVARYDSVNEFLMPSVVYAALLTLPLLGVFGIGSPAWYLLHPVQGPLSLMQPDAQHGASSVAYAIAYPLPWIGLAGRSSLRALLRLRQA
jgi:fluoroquinolone transport system permease protein